MLLELFEELPTRSNFQDDVDIHMIIKEPIHANNVGVIKKTLYFQLPYELLCDLLLFYEFLLDYLQGEYKVSFLLSC